MRGNLLVLMVFLFSCGERTPDNKASIIKKEDTTLFWTDYRIGELPPVGYYDARDSIIKKWNLRYKRIEGGCEATVADRIKHEEGNAQYFLELEKQYGKNWREDFNNEVFKMDSILKRKKARR